MNTTTADREPIRFGDRILLSPKHVHGFVTGKNYSARAHRAAADGDSMRSTKLYVEQLQSAVSHPPELRDCWFTIEPKPKRTSLSTHSAADETHKALGQPLVYGTYVLGAVQCMLCASCCAVYVCYVLGAVQCMLCARCCAVYVMC